MALHCRQRASDIAPHPSRPQVKKMVEPTTTVAWPARFSSAASHGIGCQGGSITAGSAKFTIALVGGPAEAPQLADEYTAARLVCFKFTGSVL